MKKRSIAESDGQIEQEHEKEPIVAGKKRKTAEDEEISSPELGEDLIFEVLKRADARTLATAACVSRRWRKLAEDERLWEAVCTRHWANIECGNQQLRSVVLALGGFRRLHALYLLPLLKPSLRSPAAPPPLPILPSRRPARWGKDEVQLSLSLLSIGYFEKMNHNYKRESLDLGILEKESVNKGRNTTKGKTEF